MTSSDQQLLEAARSHDRAAIETLLLRHQGKVYGYALKLCRNGEDAKDVLQDTLLAMAQSVHDFRGHSSLSTWLYAVTRSFCIKKRRRSKFAPARLTSLDDDAAAEARQLVAPGLPPDDVVAGNELRSTLDEALGSLDAPQREVLVLRDVEGLKAIEVAEVLGISVAAVKSRLHRARMRLRARLAPQLRRGESAATATASGCPDILTLYSQRLEGEVSGELCAEMERHLADCSRCEDACRSLKRSLLLCQAAPETDVPEALQQSVRSALRRVLALG